MGEGGYHDSHVLVIDAVVVHRWLEEVCVLLEPGGVSCVLLSCPIPWYLCCAVHPNTTEKPIVLQAARVHAAHLPFGQVQWSWNHCFCRVLGIRTRTIAVV